MLSIQEKDRLGNAIQKLAQNVARAYDYNYNDFYAQYDLEYAEKLYGQDLTNKQPEVIIEVKTKSKKSKK